MEIHNSGSVGLVNRPLKFVWRLMQEPSLSSGGVRIIGQGGVPDDDG